MRITIKMLSRRLRRAAERRNLTQWEIAKEIGVNQSQVSRLLNGRFQEESPALYALCKHLKVDVASRKGHVSLADFPELSACLNEILDGSRQREKAVVRLLRSARDLS